jgi:hypothetical protein
MNGETNDALDNYYSGSYGARPFRLAPERMDAEWQRHEQRCKWTQHVKCPKESSEAGAAVREP